MKIVYVSNSTLFSGSANAVHVACMCDAFAGVGAEVTLRARTAPGTHSGVAEYYGLEHPFEVVLESRLQHKLWVALHAMRLRGPTIYYGRNLPSLCRLAALGYRVAFEAHYVPRPAKLPLLQRLVRAPGFMGLVVISEALRDDLCALLPGLDPLRVLLARDASRMRDLSAPQERRTRPLRAVYMGSFHAGKGVSVILGAAALSPGVEFHLYGAPEEMIASSRDGGPGNVVLRPRIPHAEVAAVLRQYDLGLAPYGTEVEGADHRGDSGNLARWMSPLKILEYAAAGLPIVSTELASIRELLTHERTALLVPPDDSHALAQAIGRCASDEPFRLRMARAGQDELKRYTWEARAERILGFLADPRRGR